MPFQLIHNSHGLKTSIKAVLSSLSKKKEDTLHKTFICITFVRMIGFLHKGDN